MGKLHLLWTTHRFSFRTMDPLLEPNRKKGSKYQLKFYKEPQTIKRPRTEKDHSYVKYLSTPFKLGGVSATQSSFKTTFIAGSEDNVTPLAGVAQPDEDNYWNEARDNEPPLDQAYLDHISEGVTDERQKRERPKGVSHKIYATLKDLPGTHTRMRPFDNGRKTAIGFWRSSWYLKGGGHGHQRYV